MVIMVNSFFICKEGFYLAIANIWTTYFLWSISYTVIDENCDVECLFQSVFHVYCIFSWHINYLLCYKTKYKTNISRYRFPLPTKAKKKKKRLSQSLIENPSFQLSIKTLLKHKLPPNNCHDFLTPPSPPIHHLFSST